jgi:hypothetical protein
MSTNTELVVARTKLGYTGPDGKGGWSDKVYVVELVKVGDQGYTVHGLNGARNAKKLVKQPKVKIPTSYASAKAAFDSLVYEKRYNHPRTRYNLEDTWEASATQVPTPQIPTAAPSTMATKKRSNAPAPAKAEEQPPSGPPHKRDPLSYLDALEL